MYIWCHRFFRGGTFKILIDLCLWFSFDVINRELCHVLLCFSNQDLSERQTRYIRQVLAQEIPIDVRPVNPERYARLEEGIEPRLLVWMKAKGHVGRYINVWLKSFRK